MSIAADIIAFIGLALLGYGLFLLFGLGWACTGIGSIMLSGGVYLAAPVRRKVEDRP